MGEMLKRTSRIGVELVDVVVAMQTKSKKEGATARLELY